MSFTCEVIGDPPPEIMWMRDSNEVSPDGNRYVVQTDGTLVISDATEQDTGDYECVARSEMGSTKSRKARALITVSPSLRFTELPESQTVQVGTDVSFACRVDGQPTPSIQWWRNSQLLSVGGRVAIEEDGNVLRILAAKESDAARYVCRAKNSNGYAETSADLKVVDAAYSPPRLTYEPQDMEAEPGAIIEMPCRVEGVPKPVIQWKKDGSALEGVRVKVSRAGSLYLYNVSAADAGRWAGLLILVGEGVGGGIVEELYLEVCMFLLNCVVVYWCIMLYLYCTNIHSVTYHTYYIHFSQVACLNTKNMFTLIVSGLYCTFTTKYNSLNFIVLDSL